MRIGNGDNEKISPGGDILPRSISAPLQAHHAFEEQGHQAAAQPSGEDDS